MRRFLPGLVIVIIGLLFTSCEKQELPLTLPEKSSASIARVDMGEDYTDQVFFNLENSSIVSTSPVNSWDLAFEASQLGNHVFINGGKDIFVHNTYKTDFASVTSIPKLADKDWLMDDPGGMPQATAVGEWLNVSRLSKNEVYVIKMNPAHFADTFYKIQLISVDADKYVMVYGKLKGGDVKSITINKDADYNYAYFSFEGEGQVVYPEPPKNTWDIVFTRYRYIYRDLNNFPYLVSGVLLNPLNTTAAEDSTSGYETLTVESISHANFLGARDVIGFDWKFYNFDEGKYKIKPKKSYLIRTAKDQYWKLHFLDFYNDKGQKGSPSFEFERLQ